MRGSSDASSLDMEAITVRASSNTSSLITCITCDDQPPRASLSSGSEGDDENDQVIVVDAAVCAICLETPQNAVRKLACSHVFCAACLDRYSQHNGARESLPCPSCRKQVVVAPSQRQTSRTTTTSENRTSEDRSPAQERNGTPFRQRLVAPVRRPGRANQLNARAWWNESMRGAAVGSDEWRSLAHATRGVALRACPNCNAPIEKNGGCDQMRCACGHTFSWWRARPLRPCQTCHVDTDRGWVDRFHTCRHCSKSAKAQACAAKLGASAALAPVVAVGASVAIAAVATVATAAVTVAAVPAVTVGPLALAYEPVRRLRKKKTNPLAKVAASGAFVAGAGVAIGIMALGGYDSD